MEHRNGILSIVHMRSSFGAEWNGELYGMKELQFRESHKDATESVH